ncbi:TaqI-like C-terminal specificity domain-containing protein [Clostridium niameyense]|nr:TaqI-like C-terminal specificity domain-containing protein [Clostridium niameyense]
MKSKITFCNFISMLNKQYKKVLECYLNLFDYRYKNYKDFKNIIDREIQNTNDKKTTIDLFCRKSSYILILKTLILKICEQDNIKLNKDIYEREDLSNVVFRYSFEELINLLFYNVDKKFLSQMFHVNNKYEFNELFRSDCNISRYKIKINKIVENVLEFDVNLSPYDLGEIYESIVEKNLKKSVGQFYTPKKVVKSILESTIENIDVVKEPFVTIADISSGCGYFLIETYDILRNKFLKNLDSLRRIYGEKSYTLRKNGQDIRLNGYDYWQQENIHYHILNNLIYGADIDKFAIQILVINLLSKDIDKNIDKLNVVNCDSLIKWEKEFKYLKHNKDIYEFWKKEFDYIIGNPPWVSLLRKHKQEISSEKFKYYRENYKGNLHSPNLFEYFIDRAMEKTKYGGYISFVVPINFSKNKQYKNFRQYILQNYAIKNLIFNISFPSIITEAMVFTIKKENIKENNINIDVLDKRQYKLPQKEYLNSSNFEFNYTSFNFSNDIKEKIFIDSRALGDIGDTFTGFIGVSKKINKQQVNPKEIEVYKGENIERYFCKSHYYYNLIDENIKGGTKNLKKLKKKEKILVRKTGKEIIAAYDLNGFPIEQSLYGIINVDKEFDYKYILAILNSKLINWYYKNFLITNKNSTPQIKKYRLNSIPIKKCTIEKQLEIANLVDNIINSSICTSSLNNWSKQYINQIDDTILDLYDIKDRKTRSYIKEFID